MQTDYLRPYGRGGRWTERAASPELLYPRLANPVSVSNSGLGTWTWSSYVQLVASTSADFNPVMAYQRLLVQPQSSATKRFMYEIELAAGAAGSEVTFARWSDALMAAITNFNVNDHATIGRSFPLGPATIASGTRLSARIRCELDASADMLLTAHLYIAGYDGAPPGSDNTYPLDQHLAGAHSADLLATPSGSTLAVTPSAFPNYGSWVEVWSSAAGDALVWGIQGYISTGVTNGGRHVQFGIGDAGSEVAYAQLGFPVATAIGAGQYVLRRPLLVRSGERLAVRSAGGGSGNLNSQILYEALG